MLTMIRKHAAAADRGADRQPLLSRAGITNFSAKRRLAGTRGMAARATGSTTDGRPA
jgi:hypothetical protein